MSFKKKVDEKCEVHENLKFEDRFLQMIDGLIDGIVLVDAEDGVIRQVNARMAEIMGCPRDGVLGRHIQDIHPVDVRDEILALFECKHQSFFEKDISVRRNDGSLFSADINTSPIRIDHCDYIFGVYHDISQQKRREKDLQDSQEKYRALYENAPQAYQSLDENGCFLDINPAWSRVLGYERGEVIGKCFADFLHPDWKPHFENNFPVFKKRGYVSDVQFKLRHKSGRFVDVEFNGCIGYLPDGSFRQTYCVFQDITSRKKAEEQLRKREENYRSLLNNLSSGVVVHAPDTTILLANPAACRMLGLSEEQMTGIYASDPSWKFLREDGSDMPIEEYPVNRVLATGEPLDNLEIGVKRTASEDVGWMLVNGFAERGASGEYNQVIISFVEITERKLSSELLQNERQRLSGILEGTNVGTWEWHVPSGGLVINERWAQIIGYTLDDLAPVSLESWIKVCHPDDLEKSNSLLTRLFSGELDYYECEVRMRHQDGSWVWVLDRGKVVSWTKEHEPQMVMGTHQDVTGQHLLQERLRQTEKMDAIGQLAGGVAHDFNNQLAGILGYADLLCMELTNDPDLLSYAQGIIKSTHNAAELTNQLLAFGRKGKNMDIPVNIHEVIGEVVGILKRSVDKRIQIHKRLNASTPRIQGDPTQISNALLNLGINARDAMPDGGELIYETDTVALDSEFIRRNQYGIAPGSYLRIRVIDSGCGMSREVQRKIFDPFFTTKKEGKGTGLGLSSVYGTIKNHTGAINLYSEPGHGTTFRIYLPVSEAVEVKDEPVALSEFCGTGKILLVDDEPIIREVGGVMLERLGYQVETCCDGQEAVDYYREHWQQIDLVILDMIMPVLDGHSAFKAMLEINPDILAILSSGYSINGKAQAIINDGVKAFIGKPFKRQTLAETVERVLGKVS